MREAHASGAAVGGVLGDQNGRFRQQTDQHDDTRLEIDVVFESHRLGHEERACQTARYGEDDGERNEETLVERTQDEVDQQNTDTEDNGRVAAGLRLLARDAVELESVALRQHLGGDFADRLDGVARRITAGGRTVHGDRVVEVEAVEHFGTVYARQVHELAQRRHFAAVRADVDVVERLRVETVLRISLQRHVVHLREAVDVRNVLPAVVTRQRREYCARRHAGAFGFRGVDVDQILREVDVERRVGAFDFGTLVQRADEFQVDVVEIGQLSARLVLQVQREAGRGSVTRNHRRCDGEDLRILDIGRPGVDLSDDSLYGIRLFWTLGPVFELDDTHTVGRSLSGDHAVTGDLHEVADLGDVLDAVRNLLHDQVRLGESGTRSGRHVDHDRTLVFIGYQTRLGGIHQYDERHEGESKRRPHQPLVLDEEQHAVLVLVDHRTERGVERLAEAGGEVVAHLSVLVHVGFQQQGAERRRERKGIDGRDTDGHGHRDTELSVEDTRRSAHHGHGNEDGHEDQRRGDDGRRDARHGVDGGMVGRLVSHVESRLHRLDDDDGIVDDCTDRKHQCEERQQVDREPGHRQECEGSDECYENRDRGDERRADVLQEDVDHQHHEDDGFDQRFEHLVHRGVKEVVHTLQVSDFDAFRQFGTYLFEQRFDILDDLRGIRTGGLKDHRADARVAVGIALVGIGFAA